MGVIVIPLLLFLQLLLMVSGDLQEISTKHVFKSQQDDNKKLSLAGVGVRVKKFGPIQAKVYSAAVYVDKSNIISKLKKLKDSPKLGDTSEFIETLTNPDSPKSLMLRMAREVGADTMVSALADSVKPRLGKDLSSLTQFQSILSKGLRGGKVKNNMIFQFITQGNGKLDVSLDGVSHGAVQSPALVKALFGVYLDKNTVSPALKQSVAFHVASWLQ